MFVGLGTLFGGAKPTKAPRGDGSVSAKTANLALDQVEIVLNCHVANQGCGARTQANVDGWSRNQKLLDGGADAWNLGPGSTDIVYGESELYKNYSGL